MDLTICDIALRACFIFFLSALVRAERQSENNGG
jgi:hypothetical protein